ncbi:MAG: ATP synthase F1 subunit epsilon [Flavobacteriales bacterium]|nr:ATP synthase F1 subunit epsilon [Flavobacteriales bacterium]
MRVEIITPDQELFKGEASFVSVPGVDGSMGFLNDHAPLITVLKAGNVRVRTATGEAEYPVKGGVVEVQNNTVIVLAE